MSFMFKLTDSALSFVSLKSLQRQNSRAITTRLTSEVVNYKFDKIGVLNHTLILHSLLELYRADEYHAFLVRRTPASRLQLPGDPSKSLVDTGALWPDA